MGGGEPSINIDNTHDNIAKNPQEAQDGNINKASDYALNEQIIDQQNRILTEIAQSQPLISLLLNPSTLIPEYEQSELPGFVTGLQYLSSKYLMRKVRGDGNCFYRSLLFSYLERILADYYTDNNTELKERAIKEHSRIIERMKTCKNELIALGYSEVAFECFYDMTMELLEALFTLTRDELYLKFQEDSGHSEYYIWFMRLLTAAAMKQQSERFLPYILDDYTHDIETYISREVEPMGKECEQVQIQALTEYLGIVVKIEYLDGRSFDMDKGLSAILCPETDNVENIFLVTLLYRPGHYDILYPIM